MHTRCLQTAHQIISSDTDGALFLSPILQIPIENIWWNCLQVFRINNQVCKCFYLWWKIQSVFCKIYQKLQYAKKKVTSSWPTHNVLFRVKVIKLFQIRPATQQIQTPNNILQSETLFLKECADLLLGQQAADKAASWNARISRQPLMQLGKLNLFLSCSVTNSI